MANKRGESLARYLNNPNIQVFLDLISAAEGTTKHGYNTTFGGAYFEDLSKHPQILKPFTQTDGKTDVSGAAGRYQFTQKTWNGVAKELGLGDFSARNQDIGAVKLLQETGALNDVIKGDFNTAVKKTGSRWASLPSSPYKQKKRTQDWVDNFLAQRTSGDWQPASPSTLVTQPTPAVADSAPVASDAVAALAQDIEPTSQAPAFAQQLPEQGYGDIIQAMAPEFFAPGWADSVAAAQPATLVNAPEFQPWEEAILRQSFEDEGNAARNEAVASFFGEPVTPTLRLPDSLEQTINRLIASL